MTFEVPLALVTGWWIFLIVVVVSVLAVAYGYYTVWGSGISQTPYRDPTGPPESPSEIAHDITQDVRNWERGTDSGRRGPPPAIQDPIDPAVADALRQWRAGSAQDARLTPPPGAEDHARGPDDAPAVAMYVDLSAAPSRNAVRLITALAGRRPLHLVVRHLPLADVHALALPTAEALEAADAQGRFFDALDRLADAGVADEEAMLTAVCGCVPDPDRLRAEVADGRHRARVVEDIRRATASGARVVPEIFIDGAHYDGALRVDPLTKALDGVASG